ncbi:2-methoxy-6-polyprenyl-1,4-benzoquinolmethylase, mitochondrial [Apilactobacillus kunkeei]|nr:2-methoxy-6-polyprenyl-1,4-benzoquinolmethylase, mitochondrial [Apilactobacillus kunkeei]CAI2652685.1 2-methoxy-6-polyprenyl-1,4-benzoquinolmethylase, mitochondrial [Apilactobacillus kunkeei]CAI2803260.1 2-methoxy-6-polyprenyl-1,4-benzoquinolmethylase, mitochondrial [Apilactobacillus kunkeei]
MKKFTGWVKHWYRYKTDEPYIIAAAIIGALSLLGSIALDHKKRFYMYVVILILIAIWALFRSVTFKKNFVRQFVEESDFEESDKGMDLGTGTGYALIKLARDTKINKAYGVEDKYQYTIKRLEKNAYLENVKDRIEITTADIENLPFDDKTFDVITAISANGNQLSTPKKSVYKDIAYEMARVITDKGTIFMVNTPRMTKKYAIEFENRGFHVEYMHRKFERFFFLRAIKVTKK